MDEKKRPQPVTVLDELSDNDKIALVTHISEVPTADQIPLESLRENAAVDSNTNTLNKVPESIRLDRNAPR